MTASSDPVKASGHCYCGSIRFDIDMPAGAKPLFAVYCHCDSCRRAHAAPLYHVVCLDASMLRIVAGEEHLSEFIKPGGSICRTFCGKCGSRVLNRFPGWTPEGKVPLAFFPNLLDAATQRDLPEIFRPARHNCPEETVLDHEMLRTLLEHE